jgi:GTP-binding protein
LHLVDGTQENIEEAYSIIRKELELYHPDLATKKEIIGLNKCDALTPEAIDEKIQLLESLSGQKVFALSAVSKQGVDEVIKELFKVINEERELSEETL